MYINCGSLGCTSTNEGMAQGGILIIENEKAYFRKVFAEYNLQRVLDKIDSIRYPAYKEIKKFFMVSSSNEKREITKLETLLPNLWRMYGYKNVLK